MPLNFASESQEDIPTAYLIANDLQADYNRCFNMRAFTFICLFLSLSACAGAQCVPQSVEAQPDVSPKSILAKFEQAAYKAHQDSNFERELQCRMQHSKLSQEIIANTPHLLDKYDRWNIFGQNNIQLAFLQEGNHRGEEAESMFRENHHQLTHLKVAGNDVKSDNQLGLAHLLFSLGKTEEAQNICSHWKNRIRHNADFALQAVKNNVPKPPLYDTPEVEIARWDLACGKPQEGEDL